MVELDLRAVVGLFALAVCAAQLVEQLARQGEALRIPALLEQWDGLVVLLPHAERQRVEERSYRCVARLPGLLSSLCGKRRGGGCVRPA